MAAPPAGVSNEEYKRKYLEEKRIEFESGCLQDANQDACFSLGEWHQLFGENSVKAAELYKGACDKGHPNACFSLAMLKGKSASGQAEARHLFDTSCKLGHFQGCLSFATMSIAGKGGPKDCAAAMSVLEPLCRDKADARACVRVAAEMLKPDGCVARNPQEAHRVLTRACDDLGHPNACQMLTVMYKVGDGVPADLPKSESYRKKTLELYKTSGEDFGTTKLSPPPR